jgi:peptide subunit release factor 1 (eRF1)
MSEELVNNQLQTNDNNLDHHLNKTKCLEQSKTTYFIIDLDKHEHQVDVVLENQIDPILDY